MLVTVTNNDKTYTVYAFEEEHASEVIGEYTKMFWNKTIAGFFAQVGSETIQVGEI